VKRTTGPSSVFLRFGTSTAIPRLRVHLQIRLRVHLVRHTLHSLFALLFRLLLRCLRRRALLFLDSLSLDLRHSVMRRVESHLELVDVPEEIAARHLFVLTEVLKDLDIRPLHLVRLIEGLLHLPVGLLNKVLHGCLLVHYHAVVVRHSVSFADRGLLGLHLLEGQFLPPCEGSAVLLPQLLGLLLGRLLHPVELLLHLLHVLQQRVDQDALGFSGLRQILLEFEEGLVVRAYQLDEVLQDTRLLVERLGLVELQEGIQREAGGEVAGPPRVDLIPQRQNHCHQFPQPLGRPYLIARLDHDRNLIHDLLHPRLELDLEQHAVELGRCVVDLHHGDHVPLARLDVLKELFLLVVRFFGLSHISLQGFILVVGGKELLEGLKLGGVEIPSVHRVDHVRNLAVLHLEPGKNDPPVHCPLPVDDLNLLLLILASSAALCRILLLLLTGVGLVREETLKLGRVELELPHVHGTLHHAPQSVVPEIGFVDGIPEDLLPADLDLLLLLFLLLLGRGELTLD